MKKNKTKIQIYLNEKELIKVKEDADVLGFSVSEYLRELVKDYYKIKEEK